MKALLQAGTWQLNPIYWVALLCGTCMDARGRTVQELVEGAKRSTMDD